MARTIGADGSVIISSSASTVPEGASLSLNCTYTGNDLVRGIQWINNGKNTRRKYDILIRQSNPCSIQGVPGLNLTLFTYTCLTLTVFNVTRNNQGDIFTCTANTMSGSAWENINSANSVIVNVSGGVGSVIISSSAPSVPEGSSLTFNCTYTGNDQVRGIQWINNGNNTRRKYHIAIQQYKPCSILRLPGLNETLFTFTCFTLTVFNVTRNNQSDNFKCAAITGVTINSENSIIVNVSVPILTVELTSPTETYVTLNAGELRNFRCRTSGGLPKPTVEWYKTSGNTCTRNGIRITTNMSSLLSANNGLIEVESSLDFYASSSDNTLWICCAASNVNSQWKLSRSKQLEIRMPISTVVLTSPPQTYVTVNAGTPMTFTCHTSGGLSKPTVDWYKMTSENCSRRGVKITTNMTSSTSIKNGQIEVDSWLDFYASNSDNHLWICCAASNINSQWKFSNSKNLNISCKLLMDKSKIE
ncbi:nephrin-like isoform X2 [Mya arenaria]|uniref:nephrin-like isoform X2 n=1 Tax=Mya arenaria TaxID=6604 RepID=UPI0022E341FC|nr:nephrin-like isoform X2 [Mya arenaria]